MLGSVSPVSPSLTVADCQECRGISTVIFGTCSVCFAEFFEDGDDLQPWRESVSPLSSLALVPPSSEDSRHG